MLYDHRTKPESQWTYYVVDDLPRMANIYRYDTVEEAIRKFQELPKKQYSAIGSSINGRSEIDHIHRRSGQPVLVMDYARMTNPIWRESAELQEAIDTMIAQLNVKHQLSDLFGKRLPSSIIDLERYEGRELDHYFDNKLLRARELDKYLSAIDEVHVEQAGWMKLEPFLKRLDDSRPSRPGVGAKDNFVTRLNIRYMDDTGRTGYADISPRNFALMLEKTERELAPEALAEALYAFAREADPYEARDQEDTKEAELAQIVRDVAAGNVRPYVSHVTDLLIEGPTSPETRAKGLALISKLMLRLPEEVRKPSLAATIQAADREARQQSAEKPFPFHHERS